MHAMLLFTLVFTSGQMCTCESEDCFSDSKGVTVWMSDSSRSGLVPMYSDAWIGEDTVL